MDIVTSNIPIMDSTTWHHVVATKNGAAVRLYIDGADRTGPIANPVPTLVDSDAPLQIGVTGANFFPFAGSIDEVAIYRAVLTPTEVELHQRIGTTPNTGRESQLLRYPYLTDVVENYATVNWATDRSAETGVVKYGPTGSCTANTTAATKIPIVVDGTPEYQWKANLTLSPDAEYCYRVYLGDAPETDLLGSDQTPHFRTQIPAGSTQPFSFAILGDWGDTRAAPDQANVMRQIARSGARFVVTTGDNNYANGTQTEYGDLDHAGALTQPGSATPTPASAACSRVATGRRWAPRCRSSR